MPLEFKKLISAPIKNGQVPYKWKLTALIEIQSAENETLELIDGLGQSHWYRLYTVIIDNNSKLVSIAKLSDIGIGSRFIQY